MARTHDVQRFLIGRPALALLSLCVLSCVERRPENAAPSDETSQPTREGAVPGLRAPPEDPSHEARFGTVRLHAGFSPDPKIVAGSASGQVPARSIHARCSGWVASRPDYLVFGDTAFLKLYVIVRSPQRVSLVVQKPDGRVVCDDGKQGRSDPMVHARFPIGASKVWVGVPHEGALAQYTLGFSEVTWRAGALPAPGLD